MISTSPWSKVEGLVDFNTSYICWWTFYIFPGKHTTWYLLNIKMFEKLHLLVIQAVTFLGWWSVTLLSGWWWPTQRWGRSERSRTESPGCESFQASIVRDPKVQQKLLVQRWIFFPQLPSRVENNPPSMVDFFPFRLPKPNLQIANQLNQLGKTLGKRPLENP